MADTSVKAPQLRPDADVLSQDARERPALDRALEACEVAARVRATARLVPPGHEDAFAGREAEQFALRRAPAAAGAAPQRDGYEGSSSDCSTGMPAGTSSGSATSASSSTSSAASASGGAPAT